MTDFNIPGAVKSPSKPDPLVTLLIENGFEKDVAEIYVESFRRKEADPKKWQAAVDRAAKEVENNARLSRIEHCVAAFSWTEAELLKLGWYDEAGNLTVFGRLCTLAINGNMAISERNRHLKAKSPERPAPSLSGLSSASFDNSIDIEQILARFEPEGAPFFTYEDPIEDRRALLKYLAAQNYTGGGEDDRFTPTQTSVGLGYEHLKLTEEAAEHYLDIAVSLDSAFRSELGLSSELDLDDCPLLNANLYQAMDAAEPDLSMQEREEHAPSKDGKKKRGPALKKRYFKRDDMLSVISYLQKISEDAYRGILENWLIAAVSTGLRPGEWRLTSIVEGKRPMTQEPYTILYVMNRKAISGRGNDILRTLDITNMSPRILCAIRYMSDVGFNAFQKGDAAYFAMQKRCSGLLTRACRIALGTKGPNYCLYNCRHQFIANAKGMRRTRQEISYLVGRNDVMVPMKHDGHKISAWDRRYLQSFPRLLDVELKRMRRFNDAEVKRGDRWAEMVNRRTVGITPEMRAEGDF